MKKFVLFFLIILNLILYVPTIAKEKSMVLDGVVIAIDPGHGSVDKGTSYQNIYEKDINLSISLKLKEELESVGANIILTREGDYDLSTPNATLRKRSDFDNRIKIINESNPTLFISIHQNFYQDSLYSGAQVFYKGDKKLAEIIQNSLNKKRDIKAIDNSLYMFNKLNSNGILIECGFLSNANDRKKLVNEKYQREIAVKIKKSIIKYFTK